jgi:two-component system sensor histidine kinase UhpB
LSESEQRFRQIAENIRDVFWLSTTRIEGPHFSLLYVSPAYEDLWGRTCESLYRDPRSFLDTIHPEDRARATEAIVRDRERHLDIEFRVVRPDGSIRWIRDRAFPIMDDSGRCYRVAGIVEDITERKAARDQLRALAARLQTVREDERTRAAREIHDELGQALTAVKLEFTALLRDLPARDGRCSQRSQSILNLLDETIQSIRRIATELRPGILDDLGLAAAVEWLAEEFEARTGTKVQVTLPRADIAMDREHATALFRILQETLTNVARHAGATLVSVRLSEADGILTLEVHDNGHGIAAEQLSAHASLGILGMRERALLLGGELLISGAPGRGTTVSVRIPETRSQSAGVDPGAMTPAEAG